MPFGFRTFFFAISLFGVGVLSGCTRSRGLPINADGILGLSPKTFYLTRSSQSADVVTTRGPGDSAKLVTIQNKVITSTSDLDASALHFSSDLTTVLVDRIDGIFESSPVKVETVVSGGAALPPATVDTYCLGVSGAGYTELDVIAAAGQFTFVGINATNRDIIGGGALITRRENSQYVEYNKPGFGTLRIDKSNPSFSGSSFFQATFTGAPSSWASLTSMTCRLNSVPVVVTPPTHTMFYIANAHLTGNLGGLSGADAICANAAQSGTKTKDIKVGTWRAFLSSSSTAVNTRITFASGSSIKNVNGNTVVSSSAQIFAFNNLVNAIQYDQNGGMVSNAGGVFTNGDEPNDCAGWTSAASNLQGGTGTPGAGDATWWSGSNSFCNSPDHGLYCINSNN